MAWIRNGQKSGVCSCGTGISFIIKSRKELLHAEIRTGLTAPFPCPAFVRVFQGLGAVIYSITLPEPWHSTWIMMGPGHRAPFPFWPALVPHQAQKCPGPKYSSDSCDDADKGSNQGNVCRLGWYIYFLRLLMYLRKSDSFQWCELLFRSATAAPDFKARCGMSTAPQNLSWSVSDHLQNKI